MRVCNRDLFYCKRGEGGEGGAHLSVFLSSTIRMAIN